MVVGELVAGGGDVLPQHVDGAEDVLDEELGDVGVDGGAQFKVVLEGDDRCVERGALGFVVLELL